jgi:hypothetical protein
VEKYGTVKQATDDNNGNVATKDALCMADN